MIPDTRYAAVSILAFSLLAVFLFSGDGPFPSVLHKKHSVAPVAEVKAAIVSSSSEASSRFFDKDGSLSENADASEQTALPTFPIDINTASVQTLELLPGVGRKTAQRIIDKRAEKGGFRSVEELAEVRYIGRHKLEKIRPFVAVKPHKR
ncbi:MAG: helix-hairpin-helix domain-containing protein [Deltaproteobacteria bacterium]